MLPEQKSNASWLASEDRQTQDALLGGLKDEAILALPWLWRFWAFPHQLPPVGDWRSWVVMGGRGAGKTRAGAGAGGGPASAVSGRMSAGRTGGRDTRSGA